MARRKRTMSGCAGDNLYTSETDKITGKGAEDESDVQQQHAQADTPPSSVDKLSVLCGLKLNPVSTFGKPDSSRLTRSMVKGTDSTSGCKDFPQKGSTFVITKQGTVDLDKYVFKGVKFWKKIMDIHF